MTASTWFFRENEMRTGILAMNARHNGDLSQSPGAPLRVAIDARLMSYRPAGIGNYVLSLAQELCQIVPEQLQLIISRRDQLTQRVLPNARFHRAWTPPHHRFEQFALALEIAPLSCDVYHAPDFIPPFLCRVPTVVTVHDLAFLRMPELVTAQSQRYYGLIGPAVRSAARIVAVSKLTRGDLIELTGADPRKIDVVYEAPNERFKRLDNFTARGGCVSLGLTKPFLLFVGTHEPRKNLERLLRAYAAASSITAGAPDLAIVGQHGWLVDSLDGTVEELDLTERVHWLGRLSDDTLVQLYNCTVALLFPSLYEGFGLPMVEAMACGAPVLAGNRGALPEIANNAALLVDPFSIESIALGITQLTTSPSLREDLIGRGLERVRSLSWKSAAVETLDCYRRAA